MGEIEEGRGDKRKAGVVGDGEGERGEVALELCFFSRPATRAAAAIGSSLASSVPQASMGALVRCLLRDGAQASNGPSCWKTERMEFQETTLTKEGRFGRGKGGGEDVRAGPTPEKSRRSMASA